MEATICPFTIYFIPNIGTISFFFFWGEMPGRNKKIVVGKVIVAKAIGICILILYIGRIRFVINKPGEGKRMTERKEIN